MIHGAPAMVEAYGTLVPSIGEYLGLSVIGPDLVDRPFQCLASAFRWRAVELRLYREDRFEPAFVYQERKAFPLSMFDYTDAQPLLHRQVHAVIRLADLDEGVTVVGPFDREAGTSTLDDGAPARSAFLPLVGQEVRLYVDYGRRETDKWVERGFLRGDAERMSIGSADGITGSSVDWHLRGADLATMLLRSTIEGYSL